VNSYTLLTTRTKVGQTKDSFGDLQFVLGVFLSLTSLFVTQLKQHERSQKQILFIHMSQTTLGKRTFRGAQSSKSRPGRKVFQQIQIKLTPIMNHTF
jgi:hypothetical protein